MASMGFLGAMGGLGQGMAQVGVLNFQEAKQTRLEELRSGNDRENQRIDREARHTDRMTELDKGHEYSLAQELQRDANEQARATTRAQHEKDLAGIRNDYDISLQAMRQNEPTNAEKDARFFHENAGKSYEEIYNDARARQQNGYAPSNAVQLANMTKDEYRRNLLTQKPEIGVTPEEHLANIEARVRAAYPDDKAAPATGARQFSSMDEALKAAKVRYPNVDEAVLRQRLAKMYPGLQ